MEMSKALAERYTARCSECRRVFFKNDPDEITWRECTRNHHTTKPTKPGKLTRACVICGEIFTPKRSNTVICSPECIKRGQFTILERDNFQCFYCGKTSYRDRAELHLDHIHPKSKGGKDTASNLVTACIDCNLEKHAHSLTILPDLLAEVQMRNEERGISPSQFIKL
jgi:5-methylcytosine-specific restriction endonuclease McrA